jgi:hypothetical protein
MDAKKLEYLTAKWEEFIEKSCMTIDVRQGLGKNTKLKNFLITYTEKAFIEVCNHYYSYLGTPPMFGLIYHDLKDKNLDPTARRLYLNLLEQTQHAVKTEIDRILEESKKAMCIKVVNQVYNPVHNKMGYMLENGDVVFTDEKIVDSSYDITEQNIIRKLNIKSILDEE